MTTTKPVRWKRPLRFLLIGAVALVVGAVAGSFLLLRGSLPVLTGSSHLAGLASEVRVERDGNGVPTIHAANRLDAARALGFLHGQERFFQMDLMRRQSAGELAELFGPAALPLDTDARRHRFRHRAAGTLAHFDARDRQVLDAYTAGVNAGLTALSARPWEYFVLRTTPRPWTPEDTLFVVETMTLALQLHDGADERARQALVETYGEEALAFLHPATVEHSAALDGSTAGPLVVPSEAAMRPRPMLPSGMPPSASTNQATAWFLPGVEPENVPGSNSFALAGSRVAGGGALVGNDMHLGLAVAEHLVPGFLETAKPNGERRNPARGAGRGRRQQRRRGVGVHRRLHGHQRCRGGGARPGRPRALPGAGRQRLGTFRGGQGSDPGRAMSTGDRGGRRNPVGDRC